jgi:hypothetical protein
MPMIDNNLLLDGLRGLLGHQLLIRRDKAGRTIIGLRRPLDPHRKFSAPQKASQLAFREAAAYARAAKHDPIYVALARNTPRCGYNIAIADWLRPPEVQELDLADWIAGSTRRLRIRARDDVRVASVCVTIADPLGRPLEQGPARQLDEFRWEYTAGCACAPGLQVTAAARDLPGHTAYLTWSVP